MFFSCRVQFSNLGLMEKYAFIFSICACCWLDSFLFWVWLTIILIKSYCRIMNAPILTSYCNQLFAKLWMGNLFNIQNAAPKGKYIVLWTFLHGIFSWTYYFVCSAYVTYTTIFFLVKDFQFLIQMTQVSLILLLCSNDGLII